MIASKFILNILDLMLDGDKDGEGLRPQIDFLTDAEYDYTGAGLFVTFQSATGITRYKHDDVRLIIDGVTITSPEVDIGASAILFIKDGIIDFLEICCYGTEYPRKELSSYVLKQEGTYSTGRQIVVEGE